MVDLVKYFRLDGSFEKFCKDNSLNIDSEVIEIYGIPPLNMDSELGFFPVELTKGQVNYRSGDTDYISLFDFFFFMDAVKESKNEHNQHFSDIEIAEKLMGYAINDA